MNYIMYIIALWIAPTIKKTAVTDFITCHPVWLLIGVRSDCFIRCHYEPGTTIRRVFYYYNFFVFFLLLAPGNGRVSQSLNDERTGNLRAAVPAPRSRYLCKRFVIIERDNPAHPVFRAGGGGTVCVYGSSASPPHPHVRDRSSAE